jgi:hypothetical protein
VAHAFLIVLAAAACGASFIVLGVHFAIKIFAPQAFLNVRPIKASVPHQVSAPISIGTPSPILSVLVRRNSALSATDPDVEKPQAEMCDAPNNEGHWSTQNPRSQTAVTA